jgi:5'-AMP-activated protein kinase catalytic alpha subunit
VPRGDLYNLIERKGRLTEDEARHFFQQILAGVEYCHNHRVTHRDIKPENLLLDEDLNIKIGDFGLSNLMRDGDYFKTSCGSPNYAAPEVISNSPYSGPEVDVWSCGVVLYALIAGFLPFDENNIPALFAKIKAAKFYVPHHFSPAAKDLILRMLNPDPIGRITIQQIQKHPWYRVDVPMYLKLQETVIDKEREVDSLAMFRANRSYNLLDEDVLMLCLKYPHFAGQDPEDLKRRIIERRVDQFTVCYDLLLDAKRKQNRTKLNEKGDLICPVFNPTQKSRAYSLSVSSTIPTPTTPSDVDTDFGSNEIYGHPRDWKYGLRISVSSYQLMLILFEALKFCRMEWKILSNFNLRIRNVEYRDNLTSDRKDSVDDNPNPSNSLKCNLIIYQADNMYVLDIKLLEGKVMNFLEFNYKLSRCILQRVQLIDST